MQVIFFMKNINVMIVYLFKDWIELLDHIFIYVISYSDIIIFYLQFSLICLVILQVY